MRADRPDGAAGNSAAPGLGGVVSATSITRQACAHKPPTKQARVLRCLIERPHTSFELERSAFDHCPNSTISELKKRGLVIHSEMVEVTGYAGVATRIAKYTLDESSRVKAIAMWAAGQPRHG